MNNNVVKLSVIIPFHRELSLLPRAINSVLFNSTDVDETEIIVCNDGKIPEADIRRVLSALANEHTIIVQNRYLKGPGGARNTGLDVSRGSYIAFLDADDFWLPGKIETQLQAIEAGASFVATAYCFENNVAVISPPESINQPLDVFRRRGIGTSTVMITRSLLARNRFRDVRFAQDIDFWYVLASSPEFRYSATDNCFVEYSTTGSTKNKFVQLLYMRRILILNKIPLIQRLFILFNYSLSGIINHYVKGAIKRLRGG